MADMERKPEGGLDINKIVEFCKKNLKYIAGGVVTVALVAVLAVTAVNKPDKQDKPDDKEATVQEEEDKKDDAGDSGDVQDEAGDEKEEEKADENPEITELISTYYNSYASGDLDKLSGIAKKLSDMEKDYIKMMNEHVESYGDVSCTVADGAKEGSHIVCAVYQMKFADVDETLPGMNVFYVQTDKKGKLYVDNLYSSFNRELKEQKMKKKVVKLIEEFEKSEAIQKLQDEVQDEYDKKVADNEELQKKLNEMVDAIANWKDSYTPPEEGEQPEEEDQQPEEPEATDDGNADDGAADDESSDDGSTDDGSSDDGNADDGSTDDGSSDDGSSSGLNYVPEGKVLTANDGYNVRKSMDESSELVGTTAVGDSITVVLSYAEGWTKVEWNGTTGYIRTDLLLNN